MKQSSAFNFWAYLSPRFWPMWFFIGFLRLAALIPLEWIEKPGSFIGWLMYRLAPSRRRVTRINIRQAYPDYSEEQVKALVRAMYKSLGTSVFEIAKAWWSSRKYLLANSRVEGIEHLEKALAKGKGAILLTGHFTTLEIGGRLLGLYTPLQTVYKTAHNPMFDAIMYHYRAKHLVKVNENSEVRNIIKGLKEGLATWYAPDQDITSSEAIFTPYLGGMATTLTATARFSRMSGAPVVPFYPQRLANGAGFKLCILPALENFPSNDKLADATKVNYALNEMVRRNPEQYGWIHQRFKTQPNGKPSIYT